MHRPCMQSAGSESLVAGQSLCQCLQRRPRQHASRCAAGDVGECHARRCNAVQVRFDGRCRCRCGMIATAVTPRADRQRQRRSDSHSGEWSQLLPRRHRHRHRRGGQMRVSCTHPVRPRTRHRRLGTRRCTRRRVTSANFTVRVGRRGDPAAVERPPPKAQGRQRNNAVNEQMEIRTRW